MYTQEHEEQKPLISRGPTTGEIWLKGYADGYNGRPRMPQRTKRAREAYGKGFDTARQVIGFQVPGATNKPKPGKRAGSINLTT